MSGAEGTGSSPGKLKGSSYVDRARTFARTSRGQMVIVGALIALVLAYPYWYDTGAFIIGLVHAFNEGLSWTAPGSDWTQSIVFTILILILVFRPEGLLGEQTPEGA